MTGALKKAIVTEARAAGFDAVRVASPAGIGEAGARFAEFLAMGRHGDMTWLAATADRRKDPRVLWPEVRSIVMLGLNYAPQSNPLASGVPSERGAISCYAKGKDYHDVVKRGLKRVAAVLVQDGAAVRVYVDTAPLMEKPLAAAAGLGWQGKHTNLVSREHGSWLFLGAILTTADLEPDTPERDRCGTCRRCLDICPTGAFPAPYRIDARRCISYLTIEHKGHIAREFRVPIGNRVFGCDDCLAVCPWNRFATAARDLRLAVRPELDDPPLADLLTLDDAAFRRRFAGTALKRTGRDRFVRNVSIAAGNSGDRSLFPPIVRLLEDRSPLVRAMAVWAADRLDAERLAGLAVRYEAAEPDEAVRTEWQAVRSGVR
ncbi:MAG: tRNA epoxyqueuosine(34) reductase QueG [Hyphomicrobiaceae bacterium]